jgi:hypothetical protein
MKLEKRIFVGFVATIMYFHLVNYAYPADNPYGVIVERNAFELTEALPPASEILALVDNPPKKLFLTGIMVHQNITNVYLYSKDIEKRFVTLNAKKNTDEGITLMGVDKGIVEVNNNGIVELLSFTTHRAPTVFSSPVKGKATVVKKDERGRSEKKDDKKDYKRSIAQKSASVIRQVPSRRSQVDPRIIEKSLEYLSKMEDSDKREALLKRVESLQSGQHQIKTDIDQNERRRQYDERRKKRE